MLHCVELVSIGNPNNKKQDDLKAGLWKFAEQGNVALMKELSQYHLLKFFKPTDPCSLSCEDRCNALASFMFLAKKCTSKVRKAPLKLKLLPCKTNLVTALSPFANLGMQHNGRRAEPWMKKVYYFCVIVER